MTIDMFLLMLWVNSLLLGKHSTGQTGKAPDVIWVCSLLPLQHWWSMQINPDWWDLWAFPPEHHFQILKGCCTHHTSCAKPAEGERWGTKKAGSIKTLGCLMPCHQVTHIQDKICSVCSTPLQGSVPRVSDPVSRVRSRLALLLRLQGCVLSVLSLQSLPRGAHGVGCPTCAHIGKGVTVLLTLANPGRHVKGQQTVMLTCRVADGTWDWLSPSHPSGPTYKTGKELFCVPLHAPDRAAEEQGCCSPMYWATLIPRGENQWIFPVLQINGRSARVFISTTSVHCIRWK